MPDLTTRAALPVLTQHRSFPSQFEVKGLPGSKVALRGYASTFDQPYEMHDAMGAYREQVRSGAFDKTLSETPDVAFLLNHGGLTMARTRAGSLHLSADSTGLMSEAELNPKRGDVADLLAAVEDGDVDEMSFAFRVVRQDWDDSYDNRDMVELNLHRGDVSAVNFGANPLTSIGLRGITQADASRLSRHLARASHQTGSPATSSVVGQLQQVLALLATIDQAADLAQPLLAQVLGVPSPDSDDAAGDTPAVPAAPTQSQQDMEPAPRSASRLALVRAMHLHDALR